MFCCAVVKQSSYTITAFTFSLPYFCGCFSQALWQRENGYQHIEIEDIHHVVHDADIVCGLVVKIEFVVVFAERPRGLGMSDSALQSLNCFLGHKAFG